MTAATCDHHAQLFDHQGREIASPFMVPCKHEDAVGLQPVLATDKGPRLTYSAAVTVIQAVMTRLLVEI